MFFNWKKLTNNLKIAPTPMINDQPVSEVMKKAKEDKKSSKEKVTNFLRIFYTNQFSIQFPIE